MVDGNDSAPGEPFGGLCGRIGEQRLQLGIVRCLAKDRIEFAIEQHLQDLPVLRRPLGRIDIFGDVGILERHPADAVEIHAIVIGEDAPDPGSGRRRERADADALAFEIGGPKRCTLRIIEGMAVLEAAEQGRRQQHQRLAVCFRHQISNDRHLADIECLLAHHRLECGVGRRVLGEVEFEAIRAELAALHRLDMGITAEHCPQLETIHRCAPLRRSGILGIVDIDESRLRQGLAHVGHVEA
jgi:hypothetical protein